MNAIKNFNEMLRLEVEKKWRFEEFQEDKDIELPLEEYVEKYIDVEKFGLKVIISMKLNETENISGKDKSNIIRQELGTRYFRILMDFTFFEETLKAVLPEKHYDKIPKDFIETRSEEYIKLEELFLENIKLSNLISLKERLEYLK